MRRYDPRHVTYFALRGGAALGFVLSATVVPQGAAAALMCLGCGLIAVLTCIGVNAGGPGERAGAVAQERAYAHRRPPQGDWPPFDEARVVEGTVENSVISARIRST